ncbi:MAG: cell division protein FtsA [Candidatus Saccharibacteria bacterium]|nr:cell division protein FtsA [Candidatus Saccharibacteria bacterium]
MDEKAKFSVGIDIGTENVRAVVLTEGKEGELAVVGYNEGKNIGMRKGVVANLTGPSEAIDRVLGEVERMSGYQVNNATVSINGAQITSERAEGVIAVGTADHEISAEDLDRVEAAAVDGRIAANRAVLDVLPLDYTLDDQNGIKDPMGMTGVRLKMEACVVSTLTPNLLNLKKATEAASVTTELVEPSVMAGARAVLSEKQIENGVGVIDLGAATTGVAVYEEGDLQYLGVVPVGWNNITNDLAIVLQIDTEMAEDIKRRFVTGLFEDGEKDIVVRKGRTELNFSREEVNQVVRDRVAEIFERARGELVRAKYDQRLPEGIVLIGGGARMRDIDYFAKEAFQAAVKIGVPHNLGGVAESIYRPEYAAAVGLAMKGIQEAPREGTVKLKKKKGDSKGLFGWLKKF